MIQAEVNDRVHAAVKEGQAARDQQPVPLPRRPPAVSARPQELRDRCDEFENIEGEPGHHKGHDDGEDHLDGVPAAGSAPRVRSSDAVLAEAHDDGAVAEDQDHDGDNKSEECREQAEAQKEVGAAVLNAGRCVSMEPHSAVHQGGDAEHQRAGPDPSAGGSDASAVPDVSGIQELHHSQVAIHAHAGEEGDVGDAVHGDDVAAQLAQKVPGRTEVPAAVLAGRDGPQRQRQDEDQVGQSQVDHERVHQATAFVTHDRDHQDVAHNSNDKDDRIYYRQEDVGTLKVGTGTVQDDVPVKGFVVSGAVVVKIIKWLISQGLHRERRGPAV